MTVANSTPSFAPGTGKVTLSPASHWGVAHDIAVLPDGKLLVLADDYDEYLLARFNADGSLDTSYGTNGVSKVYASTDGQQDQPRALLVQADGRVLVVGSASSPQNRDFALLRLNADGSLDTTLNGTGKLRTNVGPDSVFAPANDIGAAVAVQADGKIIVGGTTATTFVGSGLGMVRYHPDGRVDTSFGIDGLLITRVNASDQFSDLLIQPDGKILVLGTLRGPDAQVDNVLLVRYLADGRLDEAFGQAGVVTTDIAANSTDGVGGLVLRPDGRIVVAAHALGGAVGGANAMALALLQYTADGQLDPSFNGTGIRLIDVAPVPANNGLEWSHDVAIDTQGRINLLATANTTEAETLLLRFNADGSLDNGFNAGNPLQVMTGTTASAIDFTSDQRVVVAGHDGRPAIALARVTLDGRLDLSFNPIPSLGSSAAYTENGAAVGLDASVNGFDLDMATLNSGLGNYSGASFTLMRQGGANAQDVFSIQAGGALFTVSENQLMTAGLGFASFSATGGTLSVVFHGQSAPPTQLLVNDVLSRIAYANVSDAPAPSVTLVWSLSDGQASGTGSSTVQITEVNDVPTGGVQIQGVVIQGRTLNASHTLVDADGMGPVSFQWRANGSNIAGASGNSYTLTVSDVGKTITVVANFTDTFGRATSAFSAASVAVRAMITQQADDVLATEGADIIDALAGDDIVRGLGGADALAGNLGADTLEGGFGDDTLSGGAGNDSLNGGEGNDTAAFAGAFSAYTISWNTPAQRFTVSSGAEGTDTLTDIESLQFSDRTVSAASLMDLVPPSLASFNPADDATGVASLPTLQIDMSEALLRGSGQILLRALDGGAVIESFDVGNAARVAISGSRLSLVTSVKLANGKGFYLDIPQGALRDAAGNEQARSTQYNFTTSLIDPLDPKSAWYEITQKIYVAYFGRPADTGGLGIASQMLMDANAPKDTLGFVLAYGSNPVVTAILDNFGNSAESRALYAGADARSMVSSVYQFMLGRAPDAEGLAFWAGAIDAGVLNLAKAALNIMAGAEGYPLADGLTIARKIVVAHNFTGALDTPAEAAAYAGNAAAATVRAMLAGVNRLTDTGDYQPQVQASINQLLGLSGAAPADDVAGLVGVSELFHGAA